MCIFKHRIRGNALQQCPWKNKMDKKGPNFTSAETHALLQSVRNNYDSIVGSFNREGGATKVVKKVKSGIWMEVTDNVNATGSGHEDGGSREVEEE
ncbi:hypothetical protein F7725_009411 [Dissostichus mawsoni]|uniref:Myb/SANT-like DNA-binding domain-containing protein n=1 Tax=Dissostichus mawsoni TaxID=36200 RepID=A0A7J5XLC1_DISMA|nr:hypothetical protein F7725_009411 [Dissostichus mawsoni]